MPRAAIPRPARAPASTWRCRDSTWARSCALSSRMRAFSAWTAAQRKLSASFASFRPCCSRAIRAISRRSSAIASLEESDMLPGRGRAGRGGGTDGVDVRQLHGGVQWHFVDAQREAGVLAAFAENFAHQIRRAVEHLRMAAETLGAMHVALDADDLADVFQVAGGRLELGDGVEGALARGLVAVFIGNLRTEFAGVSNLAIAPRQLAGSENEIARANPRLIRRHGGRCLGQGDAQFGEFVFDAHGCAALNHGLLVGTSFPGHARKAHKLDAQSATQSENIPMNRHEHPMVWANDARESAKPAYESP